MLGSLYAHVADEVHEHTATGDVVWHHAEHAPEVNVLPPLLLAAAAAVLVVAIFFVVQRWRTNRLKAAPSA